jgi:hypothetical protein
MAARKKRAPKLFVVRILGKDDVSPYSVKMQHQDRVCWVNPTGDVFRIKFLTKSPLTRVVGRVRALSPSISYRLSPKTVKDKHYGYTVRTRAMRGLGGPGGPEIVPDD